MREREEELVVDDVLREVELRVEDVIARGPAGLDAVRGDHPLPAGRVLCQLGQVLLGEHPRRGARTRGTGRIVARPEKKPIRMPRYRTQSEE